MSRLRMPLPEPPAGMVGAVLDALAQARAELIDAARIVAVLQGDVDDPEAPVAGARHLIELQVAQRRVELWAQTFARIEARAYSLGLVP